MKKKNLLVLTVLVILSLTATVFAGCGKSTVAGKQEIVYNLATEPKTIDPTFSESNDNYICVVQNFEGLARHDDNGNIKKGAAEDWKVSADGLVYTFTIRKDAKWSDGKAVTAKDFEYGCKRSLDPKLGATYAFLLTDYVKGADEYYNGKAKWEDVGIKVKDDKTLEITLKAPCVIFTQILAMPAYFPLRQDIVEATPDKWTQDPKTYIGNGPFKMVAWNHNDSIEWAKNDNYWDAKNVKLSKLTFLMVVEPSSAVASFDKGDIDYMSQISSSDIKRLTDEKKFTTVPMFGTYYMNFNLKKAPFDNIKVREAFALAINRTDLVTNVTMSGEKPATAFVPFGAKEKDGKTDFKDKGGDWYKADGDIAKAKQLLSEAGYPDGKGFPDVTYMYNTSANHKKVAEFLQDQWNKNLGINVKLINQEWNVFQDTRKAGNYFIARGGWTGDYIDPITFLDIFTTGNGFNDPKYSNSQYDNFLKMAKQEIDVDKRNKDMHDAESLLKQDLPVAPLYYYVNQVICQTNVKGVNTISLGAVYFDHAYVQK